MAWAGKGRSRSPSTGKHGAGLLPAHSRIRLPWPKSAKLRAHLNFAEPFAAELLLDLLSGKAGRPGLRAEGHNSNKDLEKDWLGLEYDRRRIGWPHDLRANLQELQSYIAGRRQRTGFDPRYCSRSGILNRINVLSMRSILWT